MAFRGWMRDIDFWPAASITVSEYIKIWCNAQVIIYPLLQMVLINVMLVNLYEDGKISQN